jgi:hypothetical protein
MPQRPPSLVRIPATLRCLVIFLTPIGPDVPSPRAPGGRSFARSRPGWDRPPRSSWCDNALFRRRPLSGQWWSGRQGRVFRSTPRYRRRKCRSRIRLSINRIDHGRAPGCLGTAVVRLRPIRCRPARFHLSYGTIINRLPNWAVLLRRPY